MICAVIRLSNNNPKCTRRGEKYQRDINTQESQSNGQRNGRQRKHKNTYIRTQNIT